uniref:Putative secreted protein n=1 Tax=Xenopsylla cheopis TaxID=163159 RepID=A0A6M2E0H4_XENCH
MVDGVLLLLAPMKAQTYLLPPPPLLDLSYKIPAGSEVMLKHLAAVPAVVVKLPVVVRPSVRPSVVKEC